MSWIKQVSINCDMCGKTANGGMPIPTPYVKKAREILKERGWIYNRKMDDDVCPECQEGW